MDAQNNVVNVNETAEAAVVDLLANIFNGIAYMDPDTVRYNIERASDGGFAVEDRSIRMELANWLMSHFSLIFVGLLVNKDFRDTFMEAVSVEIALDDRPADFVMSIREEMKDPKPRESKGNFVLNFGEYNDSIYRKVNAKIANSFEKITPFNDAIDKLVADLSEDDMIDIGYCISNFAYLVRALSLNGLFATYVKSVVHSVQQNLEIA